jgi:hypothetical protein
MPFFTLRQFRRMVAQVCRHSGRIASFEHSASHLDDMQSAGGVGTVT